jgi:hypothetical protein
MSYSPAQKSVFLPGDAFVDPCYTESLYHRYHRFSPIYCWAQEVRGAL